MAWLALARSAFRSVVVLSFATAMILGTAGLRPVSAASGPFSGFRGTWSGDGKLRTENNTERVRCKAVYEARDSTGHAITLSLECKSDNYNFNLAGDIQADANEFISGRWSERSRNIGGTVNGRARGNRILIHVESPAFSANMGIITRRTRQSVAIDTHGGGQTAKAAITLYRDSR